MKNILKIIKNKIVEFKKEYPVLLFFVFSNFLNALILRLLTSRSFLFRATLIDFGYVALFGFIALFLNNKTRRVYYRIFSFVFVAICIINSIYYNYYSSFVSVSLISTSVFLKDVSDAMADMAMKATDWIYLWQFVGLFIVLRKNKLKAV